MATEASKANLPALPLDIMVNIISRLPLKLIIGCKLLSKPFNNSISDPSFNHTYLTNNISSYNFHSIFVNDSLSNPDRISLDLLEFSRQDIYMDNPIFKIYKLNLFSSGILNNSDIFSIWGYCNGYFCFLNIDFGSRLFDLFITNPILGQSDLVKLPRPVSPGNAFLVYGLGHCQFTNNYKVLAIFTSYGGGEDCENVSYILTIGTDKDWRRVLDVNVPCNFIYGKGHGNPQAHMVAFRSALHWIVEPFPVSQNSNLEGGKTYICAFDMTEEKVTAILVPKEVEVAHHDRFYGQLVILLDKLCVWRFRGARRLHEDIDGIDLWVMDQYGVEGSWTKKFTIEASLLPKDIRQVRLRPLALSPDGLIVLSDCHNLVIYDIKKNECLKVIHLTDDYYYPIPFIPSFLSVKSLVDVL